MKDEGDIMVTARRRDERLQDVPLAITALSDAKLQALDIRDTVGIANFTPGMQLSDASFGRNDRGSARSLIFRGLNLSNGAGVTAGALVFLDGAPLIGGEVPVGDDIARVEVLRGPQNVYFGRSTLSGAVSYVTKDIGDAWHGHASAKVATFDTYDLEGSISGPVSPDFGIRLSARHAENGGYYTSAAPGNEKLGKRRTDSISLTFQGKATDRLSLKVYANYFQNDDGQSSVGVIGQAYNNCDLNPNSTTNRLTLCGAVPKANSAATTIWTNSQLPAAGNYIYNGTLFASDGFDDKLGMQRHAFLVHGILKWEIGDFATLTSLTAYHRDKQRSAADGFFGQAVTGLNPSFYYTFGYDTRDFSTELRLNSAGNGPLRWTAGANYVDTSATNQSVLYNPGTTGTVTTTLLTGKSFTVAAAKAYGFFAGAYYNITPELTLSAEGRYQIDDRTDTGSQSLSGSTIVDGVALTKRYTSFSPRITVDYKLTPNINLFASYATGVRPGGFNRLLLNIRSDVLADLQRQGVDTSLGYNEEKLIMWETGLKGAFFDRRLFTNLTAYLGTLKGQQVSTVTNVNIPASSEGPAFANSFTVTNNIGKSRIYGLEFDGSFRATENITLGATAAYNETKIKTYSCVPCQVFTGTTNVTGNHLSGAPRYTASATLDAKYPLGGTDWSLFGHADYIYRGKIFINEVNAGWVPERQLVNLRAGVEKDGLAIEAFVTNLTKNRGVTSSYSTLDGRLAGSATQSLATVQLVGLPEPRIFGGRVRYNF